jgi:putative nucleotidyltransferase with HDIG domain
MDLGLSTAQATGAPLDTLPHTAVVLRERARLEEVFSSGVSQVFEAEMDGRIMENRLSAVRDGAGTVVGISLNSRNVTETRWAQDRLRTAMTSLQDTMSGIVEAMARMVENRDPYTAGHQKGVADVATMIAEEMGMPANQIDGIWVAATIHDIGKNAVPAEILSKPGPLDSIEFEIVQSHSQAGFDILSPIEFPWPIAEMVYQHHERMDGTGYPQQLAGPEILLEARVLAVADLVEAMSSHRPWRPAFALEEALEQVEQGRGTLFDADVVDAAVRRLTAMDYDTLTRDTRWSLADWDETSEYLSGSGELGTFSGEGEPSDD